MLLMRSLSNILSRLLVRHGFVDVTERPRGFLNFYLHVIYVLSRNLIRNLIDKQFFFKLSKRASILLIVSPF
jgi:hypothetical protein